LDKAGEIKQVVNSKLNVDLLVDNWSHKHRDRFVLYFLAIPVYSHLEK